MPYITFFLRTNNDSANTHVLYCRIRLNGTVSEFSLKEKLDPKKWDQDKQCLAGKSSQAKFIDTLIDSVKYKIKSICLMHDVDSAKDVVALFRKQKRKVPELVPLIQKYIDSIRKEIAPGTYRNHEIKLQNLKDYQVAQKKVFTIESFGLIEAERFKDWFKTRAGTSKVTTANRNVLLFKKALEMARKRGEIETVDLLSYSGERDRVDSPVYLTLNELTRFKKLNFHSPMVQKIRDLFLFQCYTGLSYGDLWENWHIEQRPGGIVLVGDRIKNQHAYFVPLNEAAIELIQKYPEGFPKYHNVVYNRILKEIAALANINKKLTTHTGRKTFATLKDSEGWSRETIAKMLGHKSIKTTEMYYLGDSFSRVENEMLQRNA